MLTFAPKRRLENRVADCGDCKMARKEGGDPLEGVKGKEHRGRTSIPPLTRLPHEIGDWRSEMKIGERATLLYERAAMELTSSLWHDRVRREPVFL